MVHRSRVLSAIALALLIVFGALALAARDAGQAEARAISTGFPQPVQNAEKLRLGVNAALEQYDEATLEQRLSDLAAAGVTDIRQEFRWSDIEPAKGAPDWRAADRIVAAARRHHVQVLAVLWTTPAWARGSSGSAAFPAIETAPPADPADFAAFAGAFAARYATPNCDALRTGCAILAYQIWDEPNLSAAWGNALINPADYLRLLKAARIAIRSADPQAILVLGALAPTAEQSQVNLAPRRICAGCMSWAAMTPSTSSRPSHMASTSRPRTGASIRACSTFRTRCSCAAKWNCTTKQINPSGSPSLAGTPCPGTGPAPNRSGAGSRSSNKSSTPETRWPAPRPSGRGWAGCTSKTCSRVRARRGPPIRAGDSPC